MTKHLATTGMACWMEKGSDRIRADQVAQVVLPMTWNGATTQAIADALNEAGIATAQGKMWHCAEVERTIQRFCE